jgi:hypothetical protein
MIKASISVDIADFRPPSKSPQSWDGSLDVLEWNSR